MVLLCPFYIRKQFLGVPLLDQLDPCCKVYPGIPMHLSLDTMNMVDDACLSPSNFHEMVKAGGVVVGTRVHSIDVILGFNKDQDPLINTGSNIMTHKVGGENLGDPGKQDQQGQPYGQLPTLRNSPEQPDFHGRSFLENYLLLFDTSSISMTSLSYIFRSHIMVCLTSTIHSLCFLHFINLWQEVHGIHGY